MHTQNRASYRESVVPSYARTANNLEQAVMICNNLIIVIRVFDLYPCVGRMNALLFYM